MNKDNNMDKIYEQIVSLYRHLDEKYARYPISAEDMRERFVYAEAMETLRKQGLLVRSVREGNKGFEREKSI